MTSVITRDRKIMGGIPVIKNTRIPVSSIIHLLSRKIIIEKISTHYYPCLDNKIINIALQEYTKEMKNGKKEKTKKAIQKKRED